MERIGQGGEGRPEEELVKSRWNDLFSDPLISVSRLRDGAKSKDGLGEEVGEGHVPLRSVYWRLFYDLLPDPSSLEAWPAALADSRARYDSLRGRYLVAPDGRWAADCTAPSSLLAGSSRPSFTDTSRTAPSGAPLGDGSDAWDPLSLDTHNPWQDWFAHIELRTTIRKDVDRTFPDQPYFEDEDVRKAMVTVLFVWSMMHPDVGYRQGMHELLAVCYVVVDKDSITPAASPVESSISPLATKSDVQIRDEAMYAVLDGSRVEHDAFQLFEALMKGAKSSYEWRGEEDTRSSSSPPTAPIIRRVNHLHSELLRKFDPQLWERLESEGVEAQIWAIRWIRLIFTRELPFSTALRIWDGVFAEDPSLNILDFVCVAMLLLVRNELLNADYPTILTALLHFPAPSSTYPLSPSLILGQAIFLRSNVSPSAGVKVVMQNQEILGIRAQPPEPDPNTTLRRGPPRGVGRGPPPRGVQGLTSAWIERAQAAGLDKAILSTVADLRRNLPDTATAYSYLPNLPFSPTYSPARDPSGQFSAIPSSISAIPHRTPTFHPPSQPDFSTFATRTSQDGVGSTGDAEQQLAQLRLALVNMGHAMSGLLERLPAETEGLTMEGLGSIRDTLLAASGSLAGATATAVNDPGRIASSSTVSDSLPVATATTSSASSSPVEIEADEAVEDDGDRMALRPTQSRSPRLSSPLPPPNENRPDPLSIPRVASTPSITPSASANAAAGPSYPPLHLSSRFDRPSTGLPRIPVAERMAASLRPRSAQSQSPAPAPPDLRSTSAPRLADAGGARKIRGDPLAGAGDAPGAGTTVSRGERSANGLGRQHSLRKPGSHDPLGAG